MSVSKKLAVSIAAAFAFSVLSGKQTVDISAFFPSQAICFENEQSENIGGVTLIDTAGEIEFSFRIVEIIEDLTR